MDWHTSRVGAERHWMARPNFHTLVVVVLVMMVVVVVVVTIISLVSLKPCVRIIFIVIISFHSEFLGGAVELEAEDFVREV